MSRLKTVENDDQYFAMLERLVQGAEYLENPIITEADYRKGRELYDAIEAEIELYQSRQRENDIPNRPATSRRERPNIARAS